MFVCDGICQFLRLEAQLGLSLKYLEFLQLQRVRVRVGARQAQIIA